MSSYISLYLPVLNKADSVDAQKLLRIYGALMWSLGKAAAPPAPHPARTPPHPHPTPPAPRASSPSPRLAPQPAPARGQVVKTPECVRVYIGSFWERPLQCNEWSKQLLQARAHAPTRHPYPEPLTPKPEPFTPAPTP